MNNIPNRNHPKKPQWFRRLLVLYLAIIFGLTTFFLGTFYGAQNFNRLSGAEVFDAIIGRSDQFVGDKTIDFNTYWNVWQAIGQDYLNDDFTEREIFYGSIAGLVAALGDPYSTFFDPDLAEEFSQEIQGTFEGIGAEIGYKDDLLVIVSPLPGSPAEQAGLQPNDIILEIDGVETITMTIDMAVSLIRGKRGSTVTLTILTEGQDLRPVEIIRDTINIKSVTWETIDDTISYIQISRFSDDTTTLFNEAVQEILLDGIDGIILDLRNNPGGYLDTAIEIGSTFLGDQPIVLEQYRDSDPQVYKQGNDAPQIPNIPIVVLINGGSASASEILAGAIQDYERGILIGEQTFGKGSVQDLMEYEDGSVLKLTVAQWLTPNGRSINDEGITPDRVVELTEEDYNNDRDPQLDAAKAHLRGEES